MSIATEDTVDCKVEELQEGDRVDLESCPYLKYDASAEFEYAYVNGIRRETVDCVCVMYEGIDHVGYPLGTVLKIRRRELNPAD